MTNGVERTELADRFAATTSEVEESIGRYLGSLVSSPGREFTRTIMFAVAVLGACSEHDDLSRDDLTLVRRACGDAARACGLRKRNADMLAAGLAFQQAADACERPLAI